MMPVTDPNDNTLVNKKRLKSGYILLKYNSVHKLSYVEQFIP